jgi:hypothetical protein
MSEPLETNRAWWDERVSLHEFPYACYRMFPFLEEDDEEWWRLKEKATAIPVTFSLKASR